MLFNKHFLYTFEKNKNNMRNNTQFINHTIKQINDLSDTIYEELWEEDETLLLKALSELIEVLKQLQQDYEA